uniref:Secreted protein n=1 Tax=Steinernema glaseri TaxID=37863 RepID=A0A1I7ZCK1_9BILA
MFKANVIMVRIRFLLGCTHFLCKSPGRPSQRSDRSHHSIRSTTDVIVLRGHTHHLLGSKITGDNQLCPIFRTHPTRPDRRTSAGNIENKGEKRESIDPFCWYWTTAANLKYTLRNMFVPILNE